MFIWSYIVPPLKIRRGFLIFEIWTKGGVMKKLLRNRGLVERGEILLERGVSKLFHQFSFRKACFHYYWNTIFCLVIFTLAVINRLFFRVVYFLLENDILWISFPFTLIFKYNFVKILLFISISISLKTSNILENKSQVFEICDCMITIHNDLCYNELKI